MEVQTSYHKASQLSIFKANCLNQYSPLAQCHICQDVCPKQAILWQQGQIQITDCSFCGICVTACPTQVFQVDMPILSQLPKQSSLQLCCSQCASAPSAAFQSHCLQQFSPFSILYLLYRYSHIAIYLDQEQCSHCPQQWYPHGLFQQLETYHIPESMLTFHFLSTSKKITPSTAVNSPRRNFFHTLFHQAEEQSQKVAIHVWDTFSATFVSQGTISEEPSVFPQRLPLYALYIKKQLPFIAEQPLPFHNLICTSCTFCTACTRLCPTQALTIVNREQNKQLCFAPELCINCRLCQQVCMPQGLQWGDFLTQQQFLQTPKTLAESQAQTCTQCGHIFHIWPQTGQNTCPFCSS